MFISYRTTIDPLIRALHRPGATGFALRRILLEEADAQIGSPTPLEEATPPQPRPFVPEVVPNAPDIVPSM